MFKTTKAVPTNTPTPWEDRYVPVPESGCWVWLMATDKDGYGVYKDWLGRKVGAHRESWERANGRPVPEGLSVLHKCHLRCCVNPAHLYTGTPADNFWDGVRAGRIRSYPASVPPETVAAVRVYAETHSRAATAEHFGISKSTVNDYVWRKYRRNVTNG